MDCGRRDRQQDHARWRRPTRDRPVVLVLSRQNLPTLDRSRYAPADGLRRGAFVLLDAPDAKA